jgi:hypothetical protein
LEVQDILVSFVITKSLKMDIEQLNRDFEAIVEKKLELSKLDYSSETYDDIEEQLHDLEDDLVDNYGEYLEDVLHEIHDEYCPDNDVLLPTAYMAKAYIKKEDGSYDVTTDQGVIVDVDDYPGKLSRLVFLPNPIRIVLMVENELGLEVWNGQKS